MKKQAPIQRFLALFAILLMAACGTSSETAEKAEWRCQPLPGSFQESDLIGTWRAEYTTAGTTEEIILRADGTYRQVYQRRSDGYHFTSPWLQWWLEHRSSGGLYLHLEGMHYCRLTAEVCAMPEGGGGDWLFSDSCEDRVVEMKGEVILAVVGAKGTRIPSIVSAPRGIALMHMLSDPDTTSSFFVLKESN